MSQQIVNPLFSILPVWLAATSLTGFFAIDPAQAADRPEQAPSRFIAPKRPTSRCDLIGEVYLCSRAPAAPSSARPGNRDEAPRNVREPKPVSKNELPETKVRRELEHASVLPV